MRGAPHVSRVVSEPFAGAPHTVRHVRRLAVEAQRFYPLRALAEEIVGRLGSKDYLSEILAIYYWVLGNVRYANDPRNVELVRSPAEVLERLKRFVAALAPIAHAQQLGQQVPPWRPSLDCDDMVTLMVALLLSLGREVQITTVAFHDAFVQGQRQFSHVLIRVREPRTGQWIILDPVAAESTAEMLQRVKAVKFWPIA